MASRTHDTKRNGDQHDEQELIESCTAASAHMQLIMHAPRARAQVSGGPKGQGQGDGYVVSCHNEHTTGVNTYCPIASCTPTGRSKFKFKTKSAG